MLIHLFDVTGDIEGSLVAPNTESAWVIHLDPEVDSILTEKLQHLQLYLKDKFIFQYTNQLQGTNACNIGNAYICAADDECGTNNSHKLVEGS